MYVLKLAVKMFLFLRTKRCNLLYYRGFIYISCHFRCLRLLSSPNSHFLLLSFEPTAHTDIPALFGLIYLFGEGLDIYGSGGIDGWINWDKVVL